MRDCALRGIDCILLERDDVAAGIHGPQPWPASLRRPLRGDGSGVRPRNAFRENRILKRIASHCVEDTGGLFITLPEDDIHFQNTFMDACALAGIDARQLDPAEALRR